MKLLIVTQKVDMNDPVLGFFHRWIVEFAKNFESIVVICLSEGHHELPSNVKVLSLGKEKASSKWAISREFYRLIRAERENYDAVFVHMNPIYIVLGGFLWKRWGKKVTLWYTHREVDMKLRIAYMFADTIFTASKESFNLSGKKVLVTGHGIDVGQFSSIIRTKKLGVEPIKIIHVGRITPIKDPMTLIETARMLRASGKKLFKVFFVGGPATPADKTYEAEVRARVTAYKLTDIVTFTGSVSPEEMREHYKDVDVAVNLTPTGGVDKSVLEAMAAGVPTFSSNESFRPYFGEYADRLMFKHGDAENLAYKIGQLMESGQYLVIGTYLQKVARERADLGVLINNISANIEAISKQQ